MSDPLRGRSQLILAERQTPLSGGRRSGHGVTELLNQNFGQCRSRCYDNRTRFHNPLRDQRTFLGIKRESWTQREDATQAFRNELGRWTCNNATLEQAIDQERKA